MPQPALPASQKLATKSVLTDFVAVRQATFIDRYQTVWQEFDQRCEQMGVVLPYTTGILGGVAAADSGKEAGKYALSGQPVQVSSEVLADGTHAPNFSTLNNPSGKLSKAELKLNQKRQKAQGSYPLVKLYRQICQHYALARQRHYSPQLVAQLHQRVMVGHQLIYQGNTSYFGRFLTFIFYVFPARLRQHHRLFWVALALFAVPLVLMGLACYWNGELIYSVMSPDQVAQMEEMYNPASGHFGRTLERASDTDVMMFGHYIRNNIGIDFQMYASGLFAGVGTVVSTLYNGVVIGAVAGHLTQLGFGDTFWSFVCGHSAFELTAAVIAATAGLRLALPLVAPYPYRRKDAFVIAGKQSVQILLGAALMTFLAAFVEAFWSSSVLIPNGVKYVVSAILWSLVIFYLWRAGQGYVLDADSDTPSMTGASVKNATLATDTLAPNAEKS